MPNVRSIVLSTLLALSLAACDGADGDPTASETPPQPPPAETAMPKSTETPAPEQAQPSPEPEQSECGADKLDEYRNRLYGEDVLEEIREIVGHDRIRPIRPGDAVTMDFRPDRLNIEIGEDGRIKVLRCG